MKTAGRTFIISGGSSGLGLATAIALLSVGANVSILDLNPPHESGTSVFPALTSSERTLFSNTDVTSSDSISSAVNATLSWVSSSTHRPLGGVICCAGIGFPERALPRQKPGQKDVAMMGMKVFDRVLGVNLRGTVDLIRQTIPHLSLVEPEGEDKERGVVVVVSSVAAYEGQVGQLAYAASKGAVASSVLPLARELGKAAGIRVFGIAPGVFESGMTVGNKEPGEESKGQAAKWANMNPGMVEYPLRMGRGEEFAEFVVDGIKNPMLNGFVVRLDGAVRMPSRL